MLVQQVVVHITLVFSFLLLATASLAQVEICDNGIDDDMDGHIDLNDDDCFCEIVEPVSLIPNPSFEEMDCCPGDRSELDCASNWIQASEPTTDYIHYCGWFGWDDFPPPVPFPDGLGIMGFRDGRVRRSSGENEPFWKEYAGACLISPLQADSQYRFQFDVGFVNPQQSPPINISFFGTPSCTHLPFGIGDEAFGCPTNDPNWRKLGDVYVDGGPQGGWVNTAIEITPDEDIFAIAIGPDCPPVFSEVSIYYFFDNLLLANFESFDLQISEIQHPCNPEFTLSVADNPEFDYQWYKEGVALVGEEFADLSQNYGEGIYQVRILDGTSCRLSAEFEYAKPVFQRPVSVSICTGETFPFGDLQITQPGIYVDTFANLNNCDSIVTLQLQVIGQQFDTVAVTIFEGDEFQLGNQVFTESGQYPLTFSSSLGCDSLVLLKLTDFGIYIPTAFSPNNDAINDTFQPLAPQGTISNLEMHIYDRWGRRVFQGIAWNGNDAAPGVYVYWLNISFTNGDIKQFHGEVMLIR